MVLPPSMRQAMPELLQVSQMLSNNQQQFQMQLDASFDRLREEVVVSVGNGFIEFQRLCQPWSLEMLVSCKNLEAANVAEGFWCCCSIRPNDSLLLRLSVAFYKFHLRPCLEPLPHLLLKLLPT